jgi:hypothetical protein
VNDQPLLPPYAGAHRDPAAGEMDAVADRPRRPLPRHRARRPHWKPPLEPLHAQHVHDGEALVR